MTFTEAAIEVLRREGKPLHFRKIAEIAVRENLLDHVGKIPEEVMGGQLTTHCKLPHADRKVLAVQAGTFALVEWGLDEDPAGLDNMIEAPPEAELPYRPRERHPTPSREIARSTGRGEGRARRREEGEERRGRRYPPPAEVAYEILAGADRPLTLSEVASQGAERLLMPDAFVRDTAALAAALAEDNRRRDAAGRRPLFAVDGEQVSLAAQPEPGERAAQPMAAAAARPASATELRKAALGALRRRLRECDAPTLEHVVAALLERMGLRELKVAKRGRDHVVYTGRRKLGLLEVRHCVRILRSGDPGRREVTEVRRDVGNYGAQVGVVVSAGEPAREARGEATAAGQLPVLLLCGEALAEALSEHEVGCRPIVVPEVDEAFFRTAAEAAQTEEAARRARREERDRREGREGREGREERDRRDGREGREERGEREEREPPAAAEPAEREVSAEREVPATRAPAAARGEAPATPALEVSIERAPAAASALGEPEGDEEEEGDEEGAEEAAAPAGAASPEGERTGEGRRRRRRRRRRGGRGRNREAGAAASGPGGAPAAASNEPTAGSAEPPPEVGAAPAMPAPAAAEPSAPAPSAAPPPDAPEGGEG
ncbi:HTH domain-containing protein [Anaeromyxobacter diazotrophicus]|uniref:HTH HARE-type domain-containing protein n=1 Tax=Anaeromyxobacter diazotrophicus TaxID=2590199 RepID=A0A7I9VLN7_9BACT|nr:HTH domain-containing protein [Anaeromyxobacter diazotrophicus]GEJ57326.1 hypothetical protein AMYX_20670 [Anaeromyxobacter diazotrophicus]